MENLPQVTKELSDIFGQLQQFAAEKGHEYILPEHLLWLLTENHRVKRLISSIGGDEGHIRTDIETYFLHKVERLHHVKEPLESLALSRIVNGAFARAMSAEKEFMDVTDVFVSIMEQEHSHACYFLRKSGIDRYAAIKEISWGNYTPEEEQEKKLADPKTHPINFFESEHEDDDKSDKKSVKLKYLKLYAVNLTDVAKKGKIDPIIGRRRELDRVMQVLCRRKKNNPMLVGESGVGKTAIAEGLALKISLNEVPDPIKNIDIWALDMGAMIAGTKYRGEFEERLKKITSEIKQLSNVIIFIDEMHTVIGAGSVSSGSLDASNILKPVLSSGEIKCIGATTYDDYKNHILKDKAFSRRFQKVDVGEPSEAETEAIIRGLKPYYEKHYGVKFTNSAITTAVKLSIRYINDRFLPDKAIDIIDEAGAKNSLKDKKKKSSITSRDIELVVAEIANIPQIKVSSSDVSVLKDLETNLKESIYGQDEAVNKVSRAIKISRAGIGHKGKPMGSFLFCGPTGCGKTELAKQLAHELSINFVRFDMSEYAEKHTVSKLIGAPPGYVGYEQAGMLTEAVIKTPHCLILLDEIEKAHPDIYNILLQVMDYGTLTDNNGRKADFKNAIIIMTSNVGARELDTNLIGFSPDKSVSSRTSKAVEKYFTPEFRNRLDSIVYFNPLNLELMKKIVEKFINHLASELKSRKIEISITDSAKEWLAKNGCNEKLGARPLERLIKTEIQEKLADEILFGKLKDGGQVKVLSKNNTITLNFK